ncbi:MULTISPECIES: YafY family protein [unclassified Acinetobacter]|jgi:predicted DNA-binding transcriptional regulator YafY|uniref:helix-turn-helix transcriptional regulator n=1 Tax=Acinetobacter TaxID=469 RepID=UPI0018AC51CD|nr:MULTISPECIES: YafY family protein [unclassified Acinetobacter]MBJ9952423.1 YafY family transcriptional regulator [Acinetobacter baumannii]
MSRSIRLLTLLQLLREQRYPITAQHLSTHLDISVRSVYRDIESLRDQGVHIEGSAGLGFQLKENFLLPPMSLDETEIEAVFLALHWLKSVPDPALKNASHSVLTKLNAVLPKNKQELMNETMLRSVSYWLEVDEKIVEQVRLAIRYQVKIEVNYLDEKHNISTRVVWPFVLGYFNDKMLLAAWCELREDFRNFRLDRIQEMKVTDTIYPEFKRHLFHAWWQKELQKQSMMKSS